MTPEQAQKAVQAGMDVVRGLPGNVVAFGEMGIGNTSPASLLVAALGGVPLAQATGRGTGVNDEQLTHKQQVLQACLDLHLPHIQTPWDALARLGGFEIAAMAGAMLQAASERRVVLLDGFIATAAALVAVRLVPAVADYLVAGHRSHESGHAFALPLILAQRSAGLPTRALLDLELRLGEGSGALLAWPLVQSAASLLGQMASFESAGVSQAS